MRIPSCVLKSLCYRQVGVRDYILLQSHINVKTCNRCPFLNLTYDAYAQMGKKPFTDFFSFPFPMKIVKCKFLIVPLYCK